MKTSVFIPCTQKHIKYISGLVSEYQHGTVKPDEIVVFVSGNGRSYEVFKNTHYEKHVAGNVLAGPARQTAKQLCSGDIILYQDADDLPHPQRVEIVKHLFETMDIMHMTHSYAFMRELPSWADGKIHYTAATMPKTIEYKEISIIDGKKIFEMYFPGGRITDCSTAACSWGSTDNIQHAGACCIRREVLNVVTWKKNNALALAPMNKDKAEDYEFCMECAFRFKKSAMISAVLYQYR